MRRILEPIDLMVAIGFCATIAGGYGLYMSTSEILEAAATTPVSAGILSEQEWIQPVLGQAIVDSVQLGRHAARAIDVATKRFDRTVQRSRSLHGLLSQSVERVKTHAAAVEADHAARVQFVLGRFIVNGTVRGVRTGALARTGLSDGFNRRLIEAAEAMGSRMDVEYRASRQANLERDLAAARRDYEVAAERSQELVGQAVVLATSTSERLNKALEVAQHQVASAALAAMRVDQRAALVARTMDSIEPSSHGTVAPVQSVSRSLPEIPLGGFMLASIALLGVFVGGLMTPTGVTEAETKKEDVEKVYRKTA